MSDRLKVNARGGSQRVYDGGGGGVMTSVVTAFSVLLLTFFNTVPLHSQTVTQPQCECINTPSNVVQSCLPYDSRFQAATLEEALHNFPDLTMDQDDDEYLSTLESEATCETQECLDCQMDMRHKLEQVGLMSISTNETVVSKRTSMCKKYRFTRKDRGVYEKSSMESDDGDSSSSEEDEGKEEKEEKGDWDRYKRQHQRYKRQTLSVNASSRSVIGERFILSCTSKGIATDKTGTVPLCSSCWIWRRLPSNYSPQYINELLCDTADATCLSGYASCAVGHHAIEVIRNDNGTMTTVVLSAGSYCECRAALNSAIQSLITGSGFGGPLPPLTSSPTTALIT